MGKQDLGRRLFSFSLAVCFILTLFPVRTRAATVAEGECGSNVVWTLDDSGLLTISGTGDMQNCWDYSCPWSDQRGGVKSVEIQSGVTSIGAGAFYDCDALTSVTIADSVTYIGYSVFQDCDRLTSVELPDSVTFIDYSVFQDCDRLTSVTLSKNLTSMGSYAFSGCRKLVSVTWPDALTSIPEGTFRECKALKTLALPDSVTSIGNYAFYYCEALTSVTLPANLVSIGECAFYYCYALLSVTFPDSVTSIGASAFYDCDALTSVTIPGKVTSISSGAFGSCDRLASVTLPENITSIGDGAFSYCYDLRELNLPGKLEDIGDNAFRDCSRITALTIPASVDWIGNDAFAGMGSDAVFTVTENTEGHAYVLGNGIPYKLTGDDTESVYVGGSCGNAGDNVQWFLNWQSGLLTVSGSGGMGDFSNVSPWDAYRDKIKTLTVDSGVTSIGAYAFRYCGALTSVTIPDSVTSIENGAFYYCDSLESVTIPDSVTSIGEFAFDDCAALSSVTLPANLLSIASGLFHACTSLESIVIPDKVVVIDDGAFYECTALSSVNIPAATQRIGDSAFYRCSALTSLDVTASVLSVGDGAFRDCGELVLVVDKNSEAHKYALRDGVRFRLSGDQTGASYHGGSCGAELSDNVSWILSSSGALTVSGSGAMADNYQPWGDYRDEIVSVVVESGVTTIGADAFRDCGALTSVVIADGVKEIHDGAFNNCPALESATIPASVTDIASDAFISYAAPFHGPLVLTVTKDSKAHQYAVSQEAWFRFVDDPQTTRRLDDIVWSFSNDGASLTVSGSGAMRDFDEYAFAPWRDTLKTVTIASGVTSVGADAFRDCDALASVTLPDTLTSIGEYAFYNCDALASFTIPASVTDIDDSAFYDCPDPVLTVTEGSYACDYADSHSFRYRFPDADTVYDGSCGENARYILKDGALNISGSGALYNYAFYNADDIVSVTMSDDITSIGEWAFGDCDALSSVTIGKGVTSIGNYAFQNCDALTSVTIPDGVTSIAYEAFRYCDALASVTIPASVTEIDGSAFYDCPNLLLTVTEGSYACDYASDYGIRYRFPDADTVYDGSCGKNAHYILKDGALTISGSGAINGYAFSDRDDIVSVTISDDITSIGESAFRDCDNLASVTIGKDLTSIGNYAFYNCDALASVTIPDDVTSIGEGAFCDCDNLTSVTIPDGVTSIESETFRYCDKLASVTIPASVTEIADSAFYDCPDLILTVTAGSYAYDYADNNGFRYRFPDADMVYDGACGENARYSWKDGALNIVGSGAIDSYAFYNNDDIESVTMSDDITSIGASAFYDCDKLASVTIGKGVTSIGDAAFYGCDSLSALTLPGNISAVSGNPFAGCGGSDGLVVTVPENSATRQAIGATGVPHKLPGSETVYLAFGLWGQENSQNWNLDSNGLLTVSGSGAISAYRDGSATPWGNLRDRIRTLVVKNGVKKIGDCAFSECGSLERAFLADSVETIGKRAFYDDGSLIEVSLEEGLTSIGESAFESCSKLLSLTAPRSVSSIGSNAFYTGYYYSGDQPFMLTVYEGSYAQTYAERNGVAHQTITPGTEKVSGVTLDDSSLLLKLGDSVYLTASVQPDNAANKKVTWSSDNSAVASVDEYGIVKALSEGSANVTVTTADGGKSAVCAVTVKSQIPASVVVLSDSRQALAVGDSFYLTATVYPENASDKTVAWSTSNETVASIGEGYAYNTIIVYKNAPGSAVITATSADGAATAQCEIGEYESPTGVRLDKKSIILKRGGSDTLTADVLPKGAVSNKNVYWESIDPNVAEVSEDGKVTGHYEGKTTIVATTEDGGFTAFCLVEVTADVTSVESVALNRQTIDALECGTSTRLLAVITPEDATNQAVMWESSEPEVVAVSDNGVVTALEAEKTAVITVTTADGRKRANCVVTVSDLSNPTGLEVSAPSDFSVVKGSPLNLAYVTVTALYGGGNRQNVSDYSVSGYDRDTLGVQTITVTYQGQSATFHVRVIDRYPEEALIAQSPYKREYAIGETLDLSGLILQVSYNDGTLETVEDTSQMTPVGFRSDAPGVYPVTVTWEGLSVKFYVTVLAPSDKPVSLSPPQINVTGYPGGKRVELSAVPGAEIRYTLDGRVPSFDSLQYDGAISCENEGETVVKAVALLDGEISAVTTSRVSVSRTETPYADINNEAQLPAGTLVTLRTPTDGAVIYYTTDGSEPTAESPRYSSGVPVNANMTLKAIAVTDGFRNSETFSASYTVESRTDAQSVTTISMGSVTSRAGERVSVPVYLFTDGNAKVTFFRFTMSFDRRAFEFVSVSPAEGISASSLMVSSGANSGSVTVMYDAPANEPLDSGEAFNVTLRALDSSDDGEYALLLSAEDGITVRTGTTTPLVNHTPGVITLSGSHNAQLTGNIRLQDDDGNAIEKPEEERINVSFDLDPYKPDPSQNNGALTSLVDVYLILYDEEGCPLRLYPWNVELKNAWLSFSKLVQIPPEFKGKVDKIKIIILSEGMIPVTEATEL